MAADNQTTIAGNLVETPELRFTNTGTPVTNLRVAVTQRIQQDGEWRDGETSFFKVNVWRGQAEHLADSLSKGDRVMVTGRLRQRTWETSEGEKRSVAESGRPNAAATSTTNPPSEQFSSVPPAQNGWGHWPLAEPLASRGYLMRSGTTHAGVNQVIVAQRSRRGRDRQSLGHGKQELTRSCAPTWPGMRLR
jgi:single-strand DNA-binding protein